MKLCDEEDEEDAEEELKIPYSCVANYLYLFYVEFENPSVTTPLFNPCVVFHEFLPVINDVIETKDAHFLALKKAILLSEKLLKVNSQPLSYILLECSHHLAFIQNISSVTIYCDDKDIRSDALKLFNQYFWAFDAPGRYKIAVRILTTIEHPGLQGM